MKVLLHSGEREQLQVCGGENHCFIYMMFCILFYIFWLFYLIVSIFIIIIIFIIFSGLIV